MKIPLQIILFTAFLFSCQKDEDRRHEVNAAIAGMWQVETWTIDGDDQFRLYDSLSIEFIPLDDFGGHSVWTNITSPTYTSILEETYEIVDNGNKIFLDGELFKDVMLDIIIQNDLLIMNGWYGTHAWYYEASRK